eukprot:CAMPEP_0116847394 /NCGR_PEP_ID=MMETSP0418-20121206/14408_1 /TAXON_ID=1158023 /ORGANISM="Astrosyne radiata, Strain 13vi08-1A" /LENGTH=431 /DNA_ID=CAMNT_0004478831 /DNA_START=395 /DNA_END=1690 /DNA_ORIENTATION=+
MQIAATASSAAAPQLSTPLLAADPTKDPESKKEVWIARLLLLSAAALYGTNFSMVKILDDTVPVGIGATLRFGLAAMAMLPWLLGPTPGSKKESDQEAKDTRLPSAILGFEAGMWNSIAYLAQAIGLQTTDASKSAFICSLSVVVVPLLDWAIGKKLSRDQMWGAVLAVMGVAFLELGPGAANLSLGSGDLASMMQPVGFGIAFWRMERAMHLYPNEASRATAAQLLAVFLVSLIYGSTVEPLPDVNTIMSWLSNFSILGALFWTGIVTTAITVYMESVALRTLSAAETTLIFSTEPMWGAFFATLIMGERLGVSALAGAVLIVAGCVLANVGFDGLFPKRPESSPQGTSNTADVGRVAAFLRIPWMATLQAAIGKKLAPSMQAAEALSESLAMQASNTNLDDVATNLEEVVSTNLEEMEEAIQATTDTFL